MTTNYWPREFRYSDEFRRLTYHLSKEAAAAIKLPPLSLQQVRQQLPDSLVLENIECGYALIKHPRTHERFIADFRSFLGGISICINAHNKFHIRQMHSTEKHLKKQIGERVYDDTLPNNGIPRVTTSFRRHLKF